MKFLFRYTKDKEEVKKKTLQEAKEKAKMQEEAKKGKEGGKVITTNNGDKKIMMIRAGIRGIISRIDGVGPIIIWGKEDVDAHINDSEVDLIKKTIKVLNEK